MFIGLMIGHGDGYDVTHIHSPSIHGGGMLNEDPTIEISPLPLSMTKMMITTILRTVALVLDRQDFRVQWSTDGNQSFVVVQGDIVAAHSFFFD